MTVKSDTGFTILAHVSLDGSHFTRVGIIHHHEKEIIRDIVLALVSLFHCNDMITT